MNELMLFSTEHLVSILAYSVFFIFLIFMGNFFPKNAFASFLAFAIFIIKIIELFIRYNLYFESFYDLLPLHLCNIALILAIISMLCKTNFLFQLVFYFSTATITAILFPEKIPTFSNFQNITFFLTHFFVIFAAWYQILHFNFRPKLKGLLFSVVVLNLFLIVALKVNSLYGTNFMFLTAKPDVKSPLDYFGPWPYYIIISELIFVILGYLYFLPFRKKRLKYYF